MTIAEFMDKLEATKGSDWALCNGDIRRIEANNGRTCPLNAVAGFSGCLNARQNAITAGLSPEHARWIFDAADTPWRVMKDFPEYIVHAAPLRVEMLRRLGLQEAG